MFKEFKERFTEKLRNLAPDDDLDREIAAIVEAGTAETLDEPNWQANIQLVDLVNRNPEVVPPKVVRILGRAVAKPATSSQLLALAMLDTCMRNCHPLLHYQLAQSLLWADLIKLVQDTSVTRIDLSVRDKILAMAEDYGRYIKNPPSFKETYESLVDQGIDFPDRSPEEQAPFEVMDVPLPPSVTTHDTHAPGAPHAAAAPAAATGAGGFFANLLSNITGEPSHASGAAAGAGAAPAAGRAGFARVSDPDAATNAHANATARGGVGTVQRGGVDPAVLEGLSVEDRIAVESAMQEMALEMESAQEAAAIAASLQTAQRASAGGGGATDGALPPNDGTAVGATARLGPPPLPASNEEALQVISNSVSVFSELVSTIPDSDPSGVKDPLIRDLADQCSAYRSRLTQMAHEVTDEAQLVSALAQNDILTAAMSRYDDLLAQALSQGPVVALPAPSPTDTAARAAAATSAIAQGGLAHTTSAGGANFTLLDEDDEEPGEASTLVSMRNKVSGVRVHGGDSYTHLDQLDRQASQGPLSPSLAATPEGAASATPAAPAVDTATTAAGAAAPALPVSSPAKDKRESMHDSLI